MSGTQIPHATGGDSAPGPEATPKVRHRLSWIVFVTLGAIVCLGMGVWQLARYREASGTVQNLGYTFMWPFLAGFLVYAYLKYIRLEAEELDRTVEPGATVPAGVGGAGAGGLDDDDDDTDTPHGTPQPPRGTRARRPMTELPADLLPTRRPADYARPRDEALDAYNSYLAELARRDGAGDHTQEKHAR